MVWIVLSHIPCGSTPFSFAHSFLFFFKSVKVGPQVRYMFKLFRPGAPRFSVCSAIFWKFCWTRLFLAVHRIMLLRWEPYSIRCSLGPHRSTGRTQGYVLQGSACSSSTSAFWKRQSFRLDSFWGMQTCIPLLWCPRRLCMRLNLPWRIAGFLMLLWPGPRHSSRPSRPHHYSS